MLQELPETSWLQASREWILWFFALLGGGAGIIRILEWRFSKPKIVGEVEQSVIGTARRNNDNSLVGAHVMLQVYLVNTRIKPTTIKGWRLQAKINSKWCPAQIWAIPDNFTLDDDSGNRINIDWANSRLYDKAATDVLEYGKGVRGWLRFLVPGVDGDHLRDGVELQLDITDSINRKHRIKHKTGSGISKLSYYPGAGIKVSN